MSYNYMQILELEKRANLGDNEALLILGTGYLSGGDGFIKNSTKGFGYIKRLADKGWDAAQFWVGVCYERGEGTFKNMTMAKQYYQRAANNGNRDARDRLDELNGLKPAPRPMDHIKSGIEMAGLGSKIGGAKGAVLGFGVGVVKSIFGFGK